MGEIVSEVGGVKRLGGGGGGGGGTRAWYCWAGGIPELCVVC